MTRRVDRLALPLMPAIRRHRPARGRLPRHEHPNQTSNETGESDRRERRQERAGGWQRGGVAGFFSEPGWGQGLVRLGVGVGGGASWPPKTWSTCGRCVLGHAGQVTPRDARSRRDPLRGARYQRQVGSVVACTRCPLRTSERRCHCSRVRRIMWRSRSRWGRGRPCGSCIPGAWGRGPDRRGGRRGRARGRGLR